MSACAIEKPSRSLLCVLTYVSVFDTWTPDLSQKQESKSTASTDLDVNIDEDSLTPDQVSKAKSMIYQWSEIFSNGPTDLGKTDLVKHSIKLTN